ncbi:MAG: DsbA family protein [Acidimicrobiia bacterium]|nr:DsbA family protein [Acidimicrobiia bacterium]
MTLAPTSPPTTVEFWFDPACPFCWVTSRWIERVRPHRDLEVVWQPISLLVKNQIDADHDLYDDLSTTHGMLRVVEAVRQAHGDDPVGALYTELGRHVHHRSNPDVDLAEVLTMLELDASLADARHDDTWDDLIRTSMKDGLELTGDDVGTPLIALHTANGRRGFFGPVLGELPTLEESLQLWDGFVTMVSVPALHELKRQRTGPPRIPDERVLG